MYTPGVEPVDELALETKRCTLLEREEQQLKGKDHVTRLLFAFSVTDDRNVYSTLGKEFAQWREKEEGASELTGVLLFYSHTGLHFLEGPTRLVFGALSFFGSLAVEGTTVTPPPAGPAAAAAPFGRKRNSRGSGSVSQQTPARPAIVSGIRILYFTELHGVRSSRGWCACTSTPKGTIGMPGGSVQLDEQNAPELVFMLYKKVLLLCLRACDSQSMQVDSDRLQTRYQQVQDRMPTADDVALLLGKQGADFVFTLQEFEKIFMKPFQLVLHSELLWPMPPPLSY